MSREIHDLEALEGSLAGPEGLRGAVVQGLDVGPRASDLASRPVDGAAFLGCSMPAACELDLIRRGAIVFPDLGALPFAPYRPSLYTPEELFEGFDPEDPCSYCDTPDARIYEHWKSTGGAQPDRLLEALARRMHDLSMTDAVGDFLEDHPGSRVAVMGGHALGRATPRYADVARLARSLARKGYLPLSGGGPGAMEATHLGTWFAEHDDDALDAALERLSDAPDYKHREWLAAAFRVRAEWPCEGSVHESLGIPTWHYGHEPPNAFARRHAKYFANSIREDGLVTLADRGIVFAPGSAGTVQEIFQDATQNHYGSIGKISAMVLLDRAYWTERLPVVPLMESLSRGRPWAERWTIVDRVEDALEFLETHPPLEATDAGWSFCEAHCGGGAS